MAPHFGAKPLAPRDPNRARTVCTERSQILITSDTLSIVAGVTLSNGVVKLRIRPREGYTAAARWGARSPNAENIYRANDEYNGMVRLRPQSAAPRSLWKLPAARLPAGYELV